MTQVIDRPDETPKVAHQALSRNGIRLRRRRREDLHQRRAGRAGTEGMARGGGNSGGTVHTPGRERT